MITAIVVTLTAGERLQAALAKLAVALEQAGGGEIVVVDNGDNHIEGVEVLRPGTNLGFAGGVAHALAATEGEWVLLVNDDAELEGDHVRLLLDAAEADVGTLTGQVRFMARPEVINTAGLGMDKLAVAWDRLAGAAAIDGGDAEEVFGASACVVLYRRAMLNAIGGFDPGYFAFMEDADVAWRARMAGWRALYVPAAVAYHHGSATAGESSPFKYHLVGRNRIRMIARNATTGQLIRWGWAMVLYDVAYVTFVALTDQTLAPLAGRREGLKNWKVYRRAGRNTRRKVKLAAPTGPLGTWRQRRAYRQAAK